jgi:hypothetical protein
MSELKVNKISPATGTAFALGDSGDTFTVPSGATIVNSGTATGFGGGKVLQVLTVQKLNSFTTSSVSFVDVTDITLDITVAGTSSKVMILLMSRLSPTADGYPIYAQFLRDSTVIGSGSGSAGADCFGNAHPWSDAARHGHPTDFVWLDSPSSDGSSALTYKMQVRNYATSACYVGRSTSSSATYAADYPTSLTLMEIGA